MLRLVWPGPSALSKTTVRSSYAEYGMLDGLFGVLQTTRSVSRVLPHPPHLRLLRHRRLRRLPQEVRRRLLGRLLLRQAWQTSRLSGPPHTRRYDTLHRVRFSLLTVHRQAKAAVAKLSLTDKVNLGTGVQWQKGERVEKCIA